MRNGEKFSSAIFAAAVILTRFARDEIYPTGNDFNGAFAFIFAGLIVYMVRDTLVSAAVDRCSQRYNSPTEFTLDNGAGPMSVVQLVGHIGTSRRGVYNNAKVVKVRGVDSERALKVLLRPSDDDANGIRFRWSPRNLEGATSACLSYSVYLPKNFEFGTGGFLPGLYTGEHSQQGVSSDVDGSVMQRAEWQNDGRGSLSMHSKVDGEIKHRSVGIKRFDLPRGRWVSIEQELVLSRDGRSNGQARVFIDGQKVIDERQPSLRKSKGFTIGGERADIGYSRPYRAAKLPVNVNNIYVSRMKLRWK